VVRRTGVLVTGGLLVLASGCALISGVSELGIEDGSTTVPENDAEPVRQATDGPQTFAADPDDARSAEDASHASDAKSENDGAADAESSDASEDAGSDAGSNPGGCTTKSTSAKTPSTVTTGGSGNAWSSLANVKAQDDVGATAAGCCSGDDSETLFTTGFGFAIPAAAEIRGVTVAIRAKASSQASDKQVKLAVAGAAAGNDLEYASYTTSFVTRTYGGATNTWGLSLTPSIVNAAGFGVALRTSKPAFQSGTAEIDVVTVTVHYCE